MIERYKNKRDRFSAPVRGSDEEPVRNGLAVTPAKMLEMAEHNIPVSTSNLGVTYDEGVSKLDYTPPLEYSRGVDIADLWERQQDVRSKFRQLRDSGQFTSAEPLKE